MTDKPRDAIVEELQAQVTKLTRLANELFDALERRNADDYVDAIKEEYGFE